MCHKEGLSLNASLVTLCFVRWQVQLHAAT